MSPVKRRRRLPTLIDRGLGLLEVIMPRGPSDEDGSMLPPGQRDASGFWFPARYAAPSDIFSAAQRDLQANQRRIQRRRIAAGRNDRSADPTASRTVRTAPAVPIGPGVAETLATVVAQMEVAVPLPSPQTDALTERAQSMERAQSRTASVDPRKSGTMPRARIDGPLLPDSE